MSSSAPESFLVGQKVVVLLPSGLTGSKRYEIVRIWRYPTTFRYLLDTGYVADHAELRAVEGGEPVKAVVEPEPPAPES